ncbi:WD40 repeat domain-containing protein [Metabacillus fastidiosus]|uniref:WD40 repeat domain-containing protein n=1 Tax=Metabacillus fastidiosus TaxID=1458 RepID=UPI000826E24D|nr:WD40 repeat domain-containing protein [Metabacillus fastidiosus]MED4461150.1 WD40 repeat domain-containing protein [Metabacillus fastidiosus]
MSKNTLIFCMIVSCLFVVMVAYPLKSSAAANNEDAPFENLGPKVEHLNVIKGKLASLEGQNYYVALLQGKPAKVAVIDYETKKLIDLKELEGAEDPWSIETSPEGIVWIGTNPNGHVYKYDLKTKQVTDVGRANKKETAVWDLAYDLENKRLFGGTSYLGTLFAYNEHESFRDFGKVMPGKQYARSIAYDNTANTVYIGMGSPAALIKWNLVTYEHTNLLEGYDKSSGSVYDLDLIDGQLFAKMEGTNEIIHYDVKTDEVVNTFKANSRGVSEKIPDETAVFYSDGGSLYKYNYMTQNSEKIESNLYGTAAVSLDIVPGKNKVVGLTGNSGRFYEYDYKKNQFSISTLELPAQFVGIYRIGSSSTGDIYSSAFISGSLSKFNPLTSSNEINRIGQVEGFAEQNGKMYFGTYPNADIYEYDPKSRWSAGSNPRKLISLSDVGQSRPSIMISDEENHRLFIGTGPKRGNHSGLLTIYDIDKREEIESIELKEGQSVVSATYDKKNNILYAGTSVYDGTGKKTEESASMFKIDLNVSPFNVEEIVISKGYNEWVSALRWHPDGRVFGVVDNKFIAYYLETEKIDIYPIIPESVLGMGKNEALINGNDGYLYGSVQKNLFRVDLDSFDIKLFRKGDVNTLVSDHQGYLYFNSGANLWRVHSEKLTNDIAINPDQLQIPHVTVTESPFPIARVYTKKPVVLYQKMADGRMVPYDTLGVKKAFQVYGVEGQYYHTGGGYYIYHESSKLSPYIGRLFVLEPFPMLTPNGQLHRYIQPGEEIRVYDYDEEKYDVGNGFTIAKDVLVTYYTGSVTLLENTPFYKHGETEPAGELPEGGQYFITKADGDKLDIGDGYYILYDKSTLKYSKS